MDALAHAGLRYMHFETKAVCSSTRAAFLTGRNSHTVDMPDVPDIAPMLPEEDAARLFRLPENAWNMAQVLQRDGYATWAIGKWHLSPLSELGKNAPRTTWPLQRGFEYFYGFPRGWTDQYRPELVENNSYIEPELPEGYHLSVDLADKAIGLIDAHARDTAKRGPAAHPDQPFFLNLAFGTAHAPIQVPRSYSQKYDAIYAKGWDALREERYARMQSMGLLPEGTRLSERTADDRAWTDLSEAEKTIFARYMAVYAGFIEHCDEQIGRVLEALRRNDLERDTIVLLFCDNGAAASGGQKGEFDGLYKPNTLSVEEELGRLDELGTGATQAEYPRPWALAGVTPLRRYKIWPQAGGTRTPLIVRWPAGVSQAGALRRQLVDVIDLAPTLLAAAGSRFPTSVDGTSQIPVAGRSMLATLSSPTAPGRKVQYFELRGNRAITNGRWRAIAMHDCGTPYESDAWQLFDLEKDFSETQDLSTREPERLAGMKALWAREWARFGTGPLKQPSAVACRATAIRD